MILSAVRVVQFRNFTERDFTFNPHLTIIVGENARGKTNLLESIFFSLNGSGFRESKEEELINWDYESALVETNWSENDSNFMLQITLAKRADKVEKKYYVNKSTKPFTQYSGYTTRAVLFSPEHLDLILGEPSKRREYINKTISLVDGEYKKRLQNYETALRKRNKILEMYSNEEQLKKELLFWDGYLEQQATYVTKRREQYVNEINNHRRLKDRILRMEYLKNELSIELLEKKFHVEKFARKTTIGPQKDDFHIYLTGETEKNVHLYGSRSEQRLAVFWMKLYEIILIESVYKKKPVLLLDDVSSELDNHNKKLVLDLIENYQTIVTTTERELSALSDIDQSSIEF